MRRKTRTLRSIIWALITAILIMILTLQNRHPVQVRLFFWALPHVSLSLLILICLLLGAILGAIGVWRDTRPSRMLSLPKTSAIHKTSETDPTPPDDSHDPAPP